MNTRRSIETYTSVYHTMGSMQVHCSYTAATEQVGPSQVEQQERLRCYGGMYMAGDRRLYGDKACNNTFFKNIEFVLQSLFNFPLIKLSSVTSHPFDNTI